jgi:hypothetical protein
MRLAVVALLLSGTSRLLAGVAAPEPVPSLAGHWIFNAKKSDDAREKMRETRGDSDAQTNGAFFNPPTDMTIAQTPDEVTVFVKDGGIREIHPDGKTWHNQHGSGSAQWVKDTLVVQLQPAHSAPRTQTFSVSKDGKELTEVVTLASRWGAISVRRVYDAAPQ